jgi:hypothetical protein
LRPFYIEALLVLPVPNGFALDSRLGKKYEEESATHLLTFFGGS